MSEETTNNYLYKKRVQLLAFNMAYLRTLGLKDNHISLIVAVESFRQNENELPYPSNEKVAERMGVSTITIKRRTRELRELKLLQRPKGGIKPIWNFTPLYELLENRKKESLNRLNEVTKYQSPNGDKKVSNSSKNEILTRSIGDPVRSPQLDQNEVLTGSMGDTLKVKIKETNKPSCKVTLRDNLTIEPEINFEKKPDINFNPSLKSKRSKTALKKKTLIQEFSDYYDNLPPGNTIERLTEVLTGKVINQILVLKETEIRSRCKVFYHRINQQALTTLVLENFPYEDVLEDSKKRKFLVLALCKRAWRVVSDRLEGKDTFPLITNGISKNPVPENTNGSKYAGYVGDAPREEARRILKSLINTGKAVSSFEVRESAHSEISFRHNGNRAGTNGHGAGDKAQDQLNQDKGKPLKRSLGKSSLGKAKNRNGHRRVSDAKLHKAFYGLPWYRKFKERRYSIN